MVRDVRRGRGRQFPSFPSSRHRLCCEPLRGCSSLSLQSSWGWPFFCPFPRTVNGFLRGFSGGRPRPSLESLRWSYRRGPREGRGTRQEGRCSVPDSLKGNHPASPRVPYCRTGPRGPSKTESQFRDRVTGPRAGGRGRDGEADFAEGPTGNCRLNSPATRAGSRRTTSTPQWRFRSPRLNSPRRKRSSMRRISSAMIRFSRSSRRLLSKDFISKLDYIVFQIECSKASLNAKTAQWQQRQAGLSLKKMRVDRRKEIAEEELRLNEYLSEHAPGARVHRTVEERN